MRVQRLADVSASEEQAWNDRALAGPADRPLVAFWGYGQDAIVLGRAQRALAPEVRARVGRRCAVVDRASGGAAVLAGPWLLSSSVVLPPGHPAARSVRTAFAVVAEAHVEAIAWLGGHCLVASEACLGDDEPPVGWACFGSTAEHEIVTLDGRKLVGLAQVRRRTGTLVVAGVLVSEPPWAVLCAAMSAPACDARRLEARTASLEAVLERRTSVESVAARLRPALAHRIGDDLGRMG